MKRFKVLNVLVLILFLFPSGFSQEQNKSAETAEGIEKGPDEEYFPPLLIDLDTRLWYDIRKPLNRGFYEKYKRFFTIYCYFAGDRLSNHV